MSRLYKFYEKAGERKGDLTVLDVNPQSLKGDLYVEDGKLISIEHGIVCAQVPDFIADDGSTFVFKVGNVLEVYLRPDNFHVSLTLEKGEVLVDATVYRLLTCLSDETYKTYKMYSPRDSSSHTFTSSPIKKLLCVGKGEYEFLLEDDHSTVFRGKEVVWRTTDKGMEVSGYFYPFPDGPLGDNSITTVILPDFDKTNYRKVIPGSGTEAALMIDKDGYLYSLNVFGKDHCQPKDAWYPSVFNLVGYFADQVVSDVSYSATSNGDQVWYISTTPRTTTIQPKPYHIQSPILAIKF